jgi:diaminopimelate decarboxylase
MNWQLTSTITNRNGELFIEDVRANQLAKKYGTPLYVTSESKIREQYQKITRVLTKHYEKSRVYYSAKANSNITILKILETEGSYLDVVSVGEVFLAKKSGFSADRILFTGTNVTNDELESLIQENIVINIGSLSLLERVLQKTTPKCISFRVNPEVGAGHHSHVVTAGKKTKFGLWEEEILEAYQIAFDAGVKRFGMQMHIGAGNLTVEPFLLAFENMLSLAKKVHEQTGIEFDFIDMGGGIGIPYRPDEQEVDLDSFFGELLTIFKKRIIEYELGQPFFYVEPGRFLVCESTILLTTVNTIKQTPHKNYVGIDAGFNTLLRPILYDAYHHILVANNLNAPRKTIYDVAGPICESGDLFAKNRLLPEVREGDLLAVMDVGAYGFSMSSNYNSRPRCPEILVKNGKYAVIREQETFEDLLNHQKITEWIE